MIVVIRHDVKGREQVSEPNKQTQKIRVYGGFRFSRSIKH